jgi:hypothetical protein
VKPPNHLTTAPPQAACSRGIPTVRFMSPDFLIHSVDLPTAGVSYIVTPQNARALCWMIAHTTPIQRPQHTVARLDSEALLAFRQNASVKQLTLEDKTTPPSNRITLIPGQPVLARFSGQHADEVKELFETDTLPTPFDSRQPRSDILTAIQRQNPTATVEWESTRPPHAPEPIDELRRLLYER